MSVPGGLHGYLAGATTRTFRKIDNGTDGYRSAAKVIDSSKGGMWSSRATMSSGQAEQQQQVLTAGSDIVKAEEVRRMRSGQKQHPRSEQLIGLCTRCPRYYTGNSSGDENTRPCDLRIFSMMFLDIVGAFVRMGNGWMGYSSPSC